MSAQTLHEQLLYRVVREKVGDAMNPLMKGLGEMAKGFGAEASEAKLIVLEMIRSAMIEIYFDQKAKIEFAPAKQSLSKPE
ncbi:MAG: hypothetical protein AAB784_01225 [Patescibacteria group bacterium]